MEERKAFLSSDGITVENVILAKPDYEGGVVCPEEVSVGWTYETNKWWEPQPYSGWVKSSGGEDGSVGVWEAPTPKPETGDWEWDNETEAWVEVS